VKKSHLLVALVPIATVLCGALVVFGQQRPAQGPSVAILDLTYVFKNHARFQQMSNDMRRDVESAENTLKNERTAYQQLTEKLEQYKRGTAEFKAMEEELAERAAKLNLQVNIQKKNFLEQEAKIYYTVYQEVIDCVKNYADSAGTSLVLRFNGDPIDRSDPQEVLKELNKSVIYYNRAIDITPIILERLNGSGYQNKPAAGQQFPSATLPGAPQQQFGPQSLPQRQVR
jgi:Skp family chaperone for outer membrane proteins